MYEPIVPLPAEGYEVKVSAILELPEFGAAITSTNENVEATLRWLDAQMETETMMVAANGPINEGGPIEPTMEIQEDGKYNVLYVPENNGLYEIVPVVCGQFFAPGEYYSQIYQMPPHRLDRWYDSQMYAEAGVMEYKSFHFLTVLSKLTSEQATEITKIQTELDKYMKESIVAFIRNGVTDDSWNDFIETAQNIGADRYVEIYQEAYDNYLSMN
jgi:putative aldouronate transport system substrate-binding protein